jgi:hypothetical protein
LDDNEQNRRVSVKSRVSQSKRVRQTHSPRPAKVAAVPYAWKEDIKSLLIRLDPKFQQSVGFPTCGVKRKFVQRAGGPWISVFWWLRFSSHGGHGTHHPMNMSSRGFYCLFPKTMMPWSMLNWWWSFNITCTSSLDLPIGFSIIQLC